jgi:hypothetical protein
MTVEQKVKEILKICEVVGLLSDKSEIDINHKILPNEKPYTFVENGLVKLYVKRFKLMTFYKSKEIKAPKFLQLMMNVSPFHLDYHLDQILNYNYRMIDLIDEAFTEIDLILKQID